MKRIATNVKKYLHIAPAASQVVGLVMLIGGIWSLAGFGWALMVSGVITTAVGAGKEAGII